jgi:hypothetical protein
MSTSRHIVPLGGLRRRIEGPAPDHLLHAALIGGDDLDLSAATIPPTGTTITKISLVGGLKLEIPDGVRVELRGLTIFGGQTISAGSAGPDAPVIRIRHFGLVGGVKVRTAT